MSDVCSPVCHEHLALAGPCYPAWCFLTVLISPFDKVGANVFTVQLVVDAVG